MKKSLLSFLMMALVYSGFSQTPFTASSISVVRVGDGTTALSGSAAPVFIDEYSAAGVLLRSIPLPKASSEATGSNKMLTMDGTSSSQISMSLSQDGKKLAFVGYNAAAGTTGVSATSSLDVNRVIGVIDGAGNVNTQTALGINDGKRINSAVANGDDLWVSGDDGRVYHTTIGSNTTTTLGTHPAGSNNAPVQSLRIFNDQLYGSRASGTGGDKGPVVTLGVGLPTTSGEGLLTSLPGLPTGFGANPREFFFADVDPNVPGVDVLYVTTVSASFGVVKYSLVYDNTYSEYRWKENNRYTNASDQFTGITGMVSGTTVTLYFVKWGGQNNAILKLVDAAGYNANMPTTVTPFVAASGANKGFRGISVSPTPPATQPVSLSSFTGKLANGGVQLNWITMSERNNDYYEIYHTTDGQNFTAMEKVQGKGNTETVSSYSYLAPFVSGAVNYYKLRQVDFNGDYTEYGPVSVSGEAKNDVQLTVKENSVVLEISAQKATKAQIEILNISGQKVYTTNANLINGVNQINIPFTQGKGVYVLSVQQEGGKVTKKFLK